jgi:hypothetical protein
MEIFFLLPPIHFSGAVPLSERASRGVSRPLGSSMSAALFADTLGGKSAKYAVQEVVSLSVD